MSSTPETNRTADRPIAHQPDQERFHAIRAEVLRRAAFQAIADKSKKVGLPQLQIVGARMPAVIGRRS
jgi:hypothetical protein